ncbi:MAG: TIGR04219 family outer membrane beta-barrel protein [Desulfohalobiaceae bacterium]
MTKWLIFSVAACLCLLLLAAPASALPLLDGDAGVRYWSAKPSGDLSYDGDNLDLEDNLDFEREGVPSVYARAHIPLLMLEARYTRLDYSGNAENITTSSEEFGSITLNNDASTETTLDILHGGAMFSVPLPVVDLGLGAGVSYLDAEAEIKANGNKETATAEAPLPVAKARAEFSPPIVGLDFAVSGEGLVYSGNSFYDLRGTVGYTLWESMLAGLRVEGGYRHIRIDFDEEDLVLDANFSGPFAGVSLSF